jgi:HAD superfamily hydrolase (TIGR01484 family)
MKTLYLTDLDGTLLDGEGRVSAFSARALARLYEEGALVSAVTGRSWSALDKLKGARLRAPLALLNGARIYDAERRTILSERTLGADRARAVLALFRGAGLSPLLYTQDARDEQRVYYERGASRQLEEYVAAARAGGDNRFAQVGRLEDKLDERAFVITARGEREALAALERELLAAGICAHLYFEAGPEGACTIEACAASKREGVEELRRITGAARVVAFGDNGNDAGLFEAADVRIAVQNATPELRDMADRVIGSNREDAVAREMLKMEGLS